MERGAYMKKILSELIEVIELANTKTLWDYLIVSVPIIISVIAIFVSVGTAKRQNRIALFEKRYEVISLLGFLLGVCEGLITYKGIDGRIQLQSSMKTFYMVKGISDNETRHDFSHFYTGIVLEAGKVEYLFTGEKVDLTKAFLVAFNDYVLKICRDEPSDSELKVLEEKYLEFSKQDILSQFDKDTKLAVHLFPRQKKNARVV